MTALPSNSSRENLARLIRGFRNTLLGLSLLVAALPSFATSVANLDEGSLFETSERVVIGRCAAVETQRVGQAVVTLATVTIDDDIKGSGAEVVTIAIPGGIDRSGPVPITVLVPGAPRLTPGEDLLLFLNAIPEHDAYAIAGFSQGIFRLVESTDGGTVIASESSLFSGVSLDQLKTHLAARVGR